MKYTLKPRRGKVTRRSITVGELKNCLRLIPADTEIYFQQTILGRAKGDSEIWRVELERGMVILKGKKES